jgi:hypothetical protein
MPTACQFLTMYSLVVLFHYEHCFLLQFVQCLSVPHNDPTLGSVSLWSLLSPKICSPSVSTSQVTNYWYCFTMSNGVFWILQKVCLYLTMARLLEKCQFVHCCLLQSAQCLSVLNMYRQFVLRLYVHCCLLQSIHCLSGPHNVLSFCSVSPFTLLKDCPQSVSNKNVPPVASVSLCPLLSSTVCLKSVSTSHCTVCCFCVTMSTAVFYCLSKVCQYFTLYRFLILCHYVHRCLR